MQPRAPMSGSGAAEPSACVTAVRGGNISQPSPPPARGLPGSCCGAFECISRQNGEMRERYCCWRLNALYCPHCGLWLREFDEGKSRNWTRGQWGDKSPVARDGVNLGCKACVAANEQEEAAIMKQSLEARELLRQQLRGGEACSRMDHD